MATARSLPLKLLEDGMFEMSKLMVLADAGSRAFSTTLVCVALVLGSWFTLDPGACSGSTVPIGTLAGAWSGTCGGVCGNKNGCCSGCSGGSWRDN